MQGAASAGPCSISGSSGNKSHNQLSFRNLVPVCVVRLIAIGKLAARPLPLRRGSTVSFRAYTADVLNGIEFRDFGVRGIMVMLAGMTVPQIPSHLMDKKDGVGSWCF